MSNQPTPRRRKRSGIALVIGAVIVLVSLVTVALVSWANYEQYLEAVYSIQATSILDLSEAIGRCMTPQEWADCARMAAQADDPAAQLSANAAYASARERIQQLTDSMDLQSVSVFAIDEETMDAITEADFDPDDSAVLCFLMDFYPTGSALETYAPGDLACWWDEYEGFADFRALFREIIDTGEDTTLHETTGEGSALLTEYYPIFSGGRLAAMICVSLNARETTDFLHSFFIRTLLMGLAVTLALAAAAIAVFYLRIVRPIRIITGETERFSGEEEDAAAPDRLKGIRTGDELQQLAESFTRMEDELRRHVAQVRAVTAEKERISTELSVATRIQEDMLPRVFPPFPDRPEFSLFASMDPAKEVGGDFYDFFFIDRDHLALVIADVAGKGVPASLFMVIAKTLIKTRAQQGGTPAEILRDVNDRLCDGNEAGMFVTVWMAIIDLTTGQGMAANAGHEHPIRRNAGGMYEPVIYRHSPAVAVFDGMKFREHAFQVSPGDRIFVYTDGLPEATNAADQLFGIQRVLDELNRDPHAPLPSILPAMTDAVARFVGDAPQFDDLTMLVFEYHGDE